MITCGVDVGLENIKVLLLNNGQPAARACGRSGGAGRGAAAEALWNDALKSAGFSASDVSKTVATGQGKRDVRFADYCVTEPIADAKAARFIYPEAAATVDIGADRVRVIPLSETNRISQMAFNQKCSAGLGTLLRYMSIRLEMSLDEIGACSGNTADGVAVNDACIVFAELDALELLNQNVSREKVAGAVVEAVVVRLNAILRDKTEAPKDGVVLIGGVAKNKAVVNGLRARSGIDFIVPDHAEYGCALGAALLAAEN
jgi:predicted CoA-substrate-specific enzyme activase